MSRTQTKRSGFDRLRIAALGAGAGAMALGLMGQAGAAPVSATTTITEGGAHWDFDNSTYSIWSSASGFGVTDGSHTPSGKSDAFDSALNVSVNGRVFKDPTGTVDVSPVTGGTELTTGVVDYEVGSKVSVQQKFYAMTDQPILRQLIRFQNDNDRPVRFAAATGHNLGSDSSTVINDTFSGEQRLDLRDRWMITSDDDTGTTCGDPCITWGRGNVRFSGLPSVAPGNNPQGSGDESEMYSETFDVLVPPNETRFVMLFYGLAGDPGKALRNAKKMASPQNAQKHGLLRNLTEGQKQRIINWRNL